MLVRNSINGRMIRALLPDVDDLVRMTIWQGLNLARFLADRPLAHHAIFAARANPHRALGFELFLEDTRLFQLHRLTVDMQHTVLHLHPIAGQADQALDEIRAIDRMAEDDDISTLRLGAQNAGVVPIKPAADILGVDIKTDRRDADRRARGIGIPIGHLVDEEKIADQQRVFHRPRRNPEGLIENRAENSGDHQGPEDGFHRFPNAAARLAVARHPAPPVSDDARYMRRAWRGVKATAAPVMPQG